jgi:hypothetical protein
MTNLFNCLLELWLFGSAVVFLGLWLQARKDAKYWNKLCDYWYTKYKELENEKYIS